ncbi:MAG: MFS transporter [Rhodospirillaceae bacterium]
MSAAETITSIPSSSLESFKTGIGFGVGALGMAVVLNTSAGLLAPFMTNFLGINASTVALLFLASKLYDMVTDPLMGIVSDRTKSRWGRRRPYLLIGGILSAIGFALLFTPPDFESQTSLVVYMLLVLLLLYSGYTVFNIPYLAMPAEMTQSYHGRTVLMTYRMTFVMIGSLLATGSFALVQWLGNDLQAHSLVGLVFALVVIITSVFCFVGTAYANQTAVTTHSYSIGEQVQTAFQNRPLLLLLGAKLCQLVGFTSISATGVYFNVVILQVDYQITSAYLMATSVAVLAALPFWNFVSKRSDKRLVYMVCVTCYALVALTWLFASSDDPLSHLFIRGMVLGFFGAGVLAMGPAMLPDVIEFDFLRTGIRREGIIAAFYTTIEKLSYAIGPSIILLLLDQFGFQSGTSGLDIKQPESAIAAIYLGAAVVPSVLYVISLIFLVRYDLSEEKLIKMRSA